MCDLMGRSWALRGLAKLTAQIDEAFGATPETRDDGRLVGQAHALVSLAAVLGFPALSERCSTLEEACRSGQGVQPAFERARAAALEVRAAAVGLIADLGTGAS
jgi:HPt (histidine-containing phosphotransfer) domain-containing protein